MCVRVLIREGRGLRRVVMRCPQHRRGLDPRALGQGVGADRLAVDRVLCLLLEEAGRGADQDRDRDQGVRRRLRSQHHIQVRQQRYMLVWECWVLLLWQLSCCRYLVEWNGSGINRSMENNVG